MFTRRQFIQLCLKGMAAYSLSPLIIPRLAEALEAMGKKPVVLYMEANTCAGNFFSLMNTLNPSLQDLLFESLDIRYSNTLMTAQGEEALDILMETVEEGDYILMVEGTIPTRAEGNYGISALLGEKEITHVEMINYVGSNAKTIIAVGTCAAFGGPYAAHPNPSHSLPVSKVLNRQTINVPGCPVHPDWVVGTLSHVVLFGDPPLGVHNRPLLFYGENIHERCPRRQMFERGIFARHPGEEKCLYLIGCKGPVTYSDCPLRQWIGLHNSWPVEANTPCIGCVNADFPEKSMPFFQHLPQVGVGGVNTRAKNFARVAAGVTALGIGGHFLATGARGRLRTKLKEELRINKGEKGEKDE
ncbi:MAG: hyaluronate lyase [Candidatus Syntrophonatronum acetioxidans]|uniref:Hyaluronate lyase n=1 Tax=Candidatus Syntrophonatronum acetioxidans TaxID=1795816 RepID=A0A424YFL8_9FIRM|nr:MAG: hyaluronate lyase [Candidatus Syntrophonatronum acetioxidans]